jgi:hypothetical protein
MKALRLLTILLFFAFNACENGVNKDEQKTTATEEEPVLDSTGLTSPAHPEAFILFYDEAHDFGNIIQGEKVSYSFKFKNIGSIDLIISTARGSCGCTVPKYPRRAIKPGEEGNIDVVFNSENLSGISQKTITVLSNSNPNGIITLTIKSNIIATQGEQH